MLKFDKIFQNSSNLALGLSIDKPASKNLGPAVWIEISMQPLILDLTYHLLEFYDRFSTPLNKFRNEELL